MKNVLCFCKIVVGIGKKKSITQYEMRNILTQVSEKSSIPWVPGLEKHLGQLPSNLRGSKIGFWKHTQWPGIVQGHMTSSRALAGEVDFTRAQTPGGRLRWAPAPEWPQSTSIHIANSVTKSKLFNFSEPWFLLWFHGDSNYPYFTKSLWVLNKTQDSAWPMVNVPKWTLIFFFLLCFFGGDDSLLCTEWIQSGALWGREWGHQTRGNASERPKALLLSWEVKIFLNTIRAGPACHLKWDCLRGVMVHCLPLSLENARLLINNPGLFYLPNWHFFLQRQSPGAPSSPLHP